jgi:hypothetical protein
MPLYRCNDVARTARHSAPAPRNRQEPKTAELLLLLLLFAPGLLSKWTESRSGGPGMVPGYCPTKNNKGARGMAAVGLVL